MERCQMICRRVCNVQISCASQATRFDYVTETKDTQARDDVDRVTGSNHNDGSSTTRSHLWLLLHVKARARARKTVTIRGNYDTITNDVKVVKDAEHRKCLCAAPPRTRQRHTHSTSNPKSDTQNLVCLLLATTMFTEVAAHLFCPAAACGKGDIEGPLTYDVWLAPKTNLATTLHLFCFPRPF